MCVCISDLWKVYKINIFESFKVYGIYTFALGINMEFHGVHSGW
jgi:hypothetical protein